MPVSTIKRCKSNPQMVSARHQSRKVNKSNMCDLSTASDGKVAPFIIKLLAMLTSPALDSICGFDSTGTTLQILDSTAFEEEVLPQVSNEMYMRVSLSKREYA